MPRAQRTDGKPKGTRRLDRPSAANGPDAEASGLKWSIKDKPGPGRPKIELNEAVLYEMSKTYASYDTLARIFGVSENFIKEKYEDIVLAARAETRKALSQAQFHTAIIDRNPTMQIWLGKQYLEQKDVTRTEQTGPDGKPIQSEVTHKGQAIAYIPENHRDLPPKAEEKPA